MQQTTRLRQARREPPEIRGDESAEPRGDSPRPTPLTKEYTKNGIVVKRGRAFLGNRRVFGRRSPTSLRMSAARGLSSSPSMTKSPDR